MEKGGGVVEGNGVDDFRAENAAGRVGEADFDASASDVDTGENEMGWVGRGRPRGCY